VCALDTGLAEVGSHCLLDLSDPREGAKLGGAIF
jgi:hypothetical protein